MIQVSDPILSIRDMSVSFKGRRDPLVVVQDINLDVPRGCTLGVVGESGSGKSVTFLSVLGMTQYHGAQVRGSVGFAGRDLLSLSDRDLQKVRGREIAVTYQDAKTALNPSLTVGRQLVETLEAHAVGGWFGKRRRARESWDLAVDMLDKVGIPEARKRMDSYPHQFSGGMRQRVMIATALICQPKLLIADEPTSALDVTVQAQVLTLIEKMKAEMGMTVVLIAHDLGVVSEYCDQIAVMYAGQVVELGPTRQVLTNPRHPYTIGLIDSSPSVNDLGRKLSPMPGLIASPGNRPKGCHFAPRCPHRSTACDSPVALEPIGQGRAVRCIKGKQPA